MVALSFFFVFFEIYSLFGSIFLFSGVKIKNGTILDGTKVANNIIELTGNAKNAINLTLNGREISINEAGDFNETFVLLKGYNVINIIAKDKFGYVDEKNYKLMY